MLKLILLLIIIILSILIKKESKKIENYSNKKIKIALYSYNFGNYRNELNNLDKIKEIDNIDYYFYTNNKDLKSSKKWKIIYYPLENSTYNIDKNRYTTKIIKYNPPKELLNYDYILHLDNSKIIFDIFNKKITYEKLVKLIETNQNIDVFFNEHRYKTKLINDIYDEINFTIKNNNENQDDGVKWYNELKKCNWKQTESPIESGIFFYKSKTNLNFIKEFLFKKKLKRDQNIINYVLYENRNNLNYKIIKLYNLI